MIEDDQLKSVHGGAFGPSREVPVMVNRLRGRVAGLKVFPAALAVGAVWRLFCPDDVLGVLWPLLTEMVVYYFLGLWMLGAWEALGGPGNAGQSEPRLALAAKVAAGFGPLGVLLALLYGSSGMAVLACSVYYVSVQFLSAHRLSWLSLLAGWFCVLGNSPAVAPWEAVVLYPLAAFVTVGWMRGLLKTEIGLQRACR